MRDRTRTALEQALDPGTSSRRLAALARDRDPEVVRAVAANGNTSDRVLGALVFRHPDQVAVNPRVVLVALAGGLPGFLPVEGRALLLAQPTMPLEALAASVSGSPLEQIALLTNPQYLGSPPLLALEGKMQYEAVAAYTALLHGLPPVPASVRPRLPRVFHVLDPYAPVQRLQEEIRALNLLGPARMSGVERWRGESLVNAFLRRPDLPAQLVEHLLVNVARWQRDAQRRARGRPADERVYSAWGETLVAHPALAPCLSALISSDHHEVRAWSAVHWRAGGAPSPLDPVATSPIERGLAARATRDPEVLSRLARDPNPKVRWVVARHPDTSPADVERLAADSACAKVAEAALARLDHPDVAIRAAARCRWTSARVRLARRTPHPAVLAALAADPNAWVRAAVAGRVTDVGVCAQLLADPSLLVQQAAKKGRR